MRENKFGVDKDLISRAVHNVKSSEEWRNKRKTEKAKEEPRSNQPEKLETYNIPSDYHVSNPMYQSFEQKLTSALNTLYS